MQPRKGTRRNVSFFIYFTLLEYLLALHEPLGQDHVSSFGAAQELLERGPLLLAFGAAPRLVARNPTHKRNPNTRYKYKK